MFGVLTTHLLFLLNKNPAPFNEVEERMKRRGLENDCPHGTEENVQNCKF
jgi:hypothetical protein